MVIPFLIKLFVYFVAFLLFLYVHTTLFHQFYILHWCTRKISARKFINTKDKPCCTIAFWMCNLIFTASINLLWHQCLSKAVYCYSNSICINYMLQKWKLYDYFYWLKRWVCGSCTAFTDAEQKTHLSAFTGQVVFNKNTLFCLGIFTKTAWRAVHTWILQRQHVCVCVVWR